MTVSAIGSETRSPAEVGLLFPPLGVSHADSLSAQRQPDGPAVDAELATDAAPADQPNIACMMRSEYEGWS